MFPVSAFEAWDWWGGHRHWFWYNRGKAGETGQSLLRHFNLYKDWTMWVFWILVYRGLFNLNFTLISFWILKSGAICIYNLFFFFFNKKMYSFRIAIAYIFHLDFLSWNDINKFESCYEQKLRITISDNDLINLLYLSHTPTGVISYTELGNTIPGKEFNFFLHFVFFIYSWNCSCRNKQKYELTLSHQ